MLHQFAVPNFDTPSIVVVDENDDKHAPRTSPEGLEGEKQFFKLLLMVEIFNNYHKGKLPVDMIQKFDPIQLFLQAKLFDECKIT